MVGCSPVLGQHAAPGILLRRRGRGVGELVASVCWGESAFLHPPWLWFSTRHLSTQCGVNFAKFAVDVIYCAADCRAWSFSGSSQPISR
eukprot:3601357-Pyramimonas_sp.AAC.1